MCVHGRTWHCARVFLGIPYILAYTTEDYDARLRPPRGSLLTTALGAWAYPRLKSWVRHWVEAVPTLEAVAEEAHQAAVVHVGDDGELSPEVLLAGHGAPPVDVDPLDGDGRAVVEVPSEDLGGAAAPYHASEVLRHGLDFIA